MRRVYVSKKEKSICLNLLLIHYQKLFISVIIQKTNTNSFCEICSTAMGLDFLKKKKWPTTSIKILKKMWESEQKKNLRQIESKLSL